MRLAVTLTTLLICLWLLTGSGASTFTRGTPAQGEKKPQDVYLLAQESKMGKVTFNHLNHITQSRNLDGTGPVTCVECHHTAQPASEFAKLPPLKTAFPADRTTTLTAELLAKDPNALGGVTCHKCHARAGMKPEAWPEIPQIKHEVSTAIITLTNQQAFHRNCAGCHDEVVKHRKDVNPPTSMKCAGCHKK
ncbi:MAG: cytochrome c3 family protein [Pyrinomonadaceae bacterium]